MCLKSYSVQKYSELSHGGRILELPREFPFRALRSSSLRVGAPVLGLSLQTYRVLSWEDTQAIDLVCCERVGRVKADIS